MRQSYGHVGRTRRRRRRRRGRAIAFLAVAFAVVAAAAIAGTALVLRGDVPGRGDTVRNPSVTTVIGRSREGRPIEAVTLGSGPTVVAIVGALHAGPESGTREVAQRLLRHFRSRPLPPGLQLVFIPAANPDGLAARTRENARGVDLNRNWPTADWRPDAIHTGEPASGGDAPLSEPETRALHDFLLTIQPVLTLSYHGYGGLVEDNGTGLARSLALIYAEEAGYEHIEEWTEYEITGELIGALAEAGLAAADIELIEDDRRAAARNIRALEAVVAALSEAR